MEVEESMEDLAMKGSKMEKAERKRLHHLRKVKKDLKVEDSWDEEPLEAMEIVESLVEIIEGMKDPIVKKLLGKHHKAAVNGLIDSTIAIKAVAKEEAGSILAKI
jgi:hypothetical protein